MADPERTMISLSKASANFSDLAAQAKEGAETIICKNGERYVALIGVERLDYYHRLERARIQLLLMDDARLGLEDVAAGKVSDARNTLARMKRRRDTESLGKRQ